MGSASVAGWEEGRGADGSRRAVADARDKDRTSPMPGVESAQVCSKPAKTKERNMTAQARIWILKTWLNSWPPRRGAMSESGCHNLSGCHAVDHSRHDVHE